MFRPAEPEAGAAGYTATDENGVCVGECRFTYDALEMKFTSVSCGDDLIKEGLVRSSMNYCANRGVYLSTVSPVMLCPALNRLGFSGDSLTVEIPEALSSSCCSCADKSE